MRLKFLLRPGWIGLILLVVLFATLCFTLLAPWQFGRDDETQARNAAITHSFTADPQPLAEVLPGGAAPGPDTEWTKITATGSYLPEGETLAWLRSVQGEPAIEVLTPFRTTTGETLLVDRGFLRPVGTDAPDYDPAPAGQVTITARVRMDERDQEHRPVFDRQGHRWTYSVDSHVVGAGTGIALRPGYFALVEDQPGTLGALPLPQLSSGPYFSYALQWISFGVMALAAIGYLIYAELRPPEDAATGGARKPRKMSVAEAVAEDERREREQAGSGE
ncbi:MULTISPECIES: SURF1 family protein [Saccharopolyspora]|uniref:SURF1-like protein n=1 Tax=Saccharopolyspora gregorii TaxID=33914 RepID=A0ABP6RW32_9PSEU|nr:MULTISPECIES: SURF1 family cytochrome oxidase biogenesis protein [Saccharopolyspora]MCA1186694.1 SURF1 family protein [Saccharopolyspora sp. 6T]MCA1192555.1 SURF1 family protein [Saccharopolyspora sp. 6V]MCA1225310.1 SURF1 family protein [Saccharopolyspora sp. 6M]MCA1278898.1 SURF1 family protein [Saccharopolyspora sp. 7B]